jgi:Trk K+ transport system NAD-binding subunit
VTTPADLAAWGARSPSERPRHVVIVGAGRVGTEVADRLPDTWSVGVVDVDPAAEARIRELRPDATFVTGDGSSRLTLAGCGLTRASVLIAATPSPAVNREAARVARAHFGVEEVIVVTSEVPEALEEGEKPGDFLAPAEAVAGRIVNRVSIEASRAVDIGLGVGEILQVTVLEGSPAAGRALREFGARHWLVAAVYRSGHLIVPHGDTRVEAGDRVLLVGEPKDLQDVAPYFRGGAPVFPSQYGPRVAWVGEDAAPPFARWFLSLVDGDSLVEAPPRLRNLADVASADWVSWLDTECVGCVVMGPVRLPWYVRLGLVRSRLATALAAAHRPFLVHRGGPTTIRRVLVCVRDPRAQREVLLAGIDVARLAGAVIDTLMVDPPGTPAPPSAAADLDRLGRLYGVELTHRRLTGNPVSIIRDAAREADLVVLGFRPEHNSPLAPDPSTWLLHELGSAALFVPWTAGSP